MLLSQRMVATLFTLALILAVVGWAVARADSNDKETVTHGRYAIAVSNDHAIILDTKVGCAWHANSIKLQQTGGVNSTVLSKFTLISIEGLIDIPQRSQEAGQTPRNIPEKCRT
jgi:hypothetical protein